MLASAASVPSSPNGAIITARGPCSFPPTTSSFCAAVSRVMRQIHRSRAEEMQDDGTVAAKATRHNGWRRSGPAAGWRPFVRAVPPNLVPRQQNYCASSTIVHSVPGTLALAWRTLS